MTHPYAARLAALSVQQHTVSIDGSTTSYWEYGAAGNEPTVVVCHGFRGDHHGLEPVFAYLPDAHIIAPDIPGFGATAPLPGGTHNLDRYARWLAEFTRTVAPGAIILGHSFGSIISSAAVAYGLNTPALVLINPIGAPALQGPKRLMTQLAILYYALGARLPERYGTALLRHPAIVRIMSLTMVKSKVPAVRRFVHAQHDAYFSNFADRDVLRDAFVASVSHDVREFAPRVQVPTLLIAAQRDDITPIAAERTLAGEFADAHLVEIPEVGHLIHYETPAEAASAIDNFLSARVWQDR